MSTISFKMIENGRALLDRLADMLEIKVIDDWYSIEREGATITKKYTKLKENIDIRNALLSNYPDTEWQPWRFSSCPRQYWQDRANSLKFLDWMAEQCQFTSYLQFQTLKVEDYEKFGAKGLLQTYNMSISMVISIIFQNI
jgi:hypothetical protein